MDCKTCKENRATSPYIVHEGELARMERANKRLFAAWLITFLFLVGTFAGFLWTAGSFETTTTTSVHQVAETGSNAYISGSVSGINGK